jgi:hypothetical protein
MEVLSQEVVTFGDMFCQMHDLVRASMCRVFANLRFGRPVVHLD